MFGEDVSNLVGRRKILNMELVLKNFITNKMKVEFNMLCWCVKTGLAARWVALWLSHQRIGGIVGERHNSVSRD